MKRTQINRRQHNTVYHKTLKYLYMYIIISRYQLVQGNVHALNRTTGLDSGSISTDSRVNCLDFNIWIPKSSPTQLNHRYWNVSQNKYKLNSKLTEPNICLNTFSS